MDYTDLKAILFVEWQPLIDIPAPKRAIDAPEDIVIGDVFYPLNPRFLHDKRFIKSHIEFSPAVVFKSFPPYEFVS